MKKKMLVAVIVCSLLMTKSVVAQNPYVTNLQHNGVATMFYGMNSFSDAYSASVNGDTLYLSSGSYNAPATIAKHLTIYGVGAYSDSLGLLSRTVIIQGLAINKGADSLRIEGLFINGDINYDGSNAISNVKIIRCCFNNSTYGSGGSVNAKINCTIEECFDNGSIN